MIMDKEVLDSVYTPTDAMIAEVMGDISDIISPIAKAVDASFDSFAATVESLDLGTTEHMAIATAAVVVEEAVGDLAKASAHLMARLVNTLRFSSELVEELEAKVAELEAALAEAV